MKPTIWIFALEPIETRYTCEWHEHLPKLLLTKLGDKFNVVQIDGIQNNTQPTPGAFLNFSDTNYWKSSQFCKFLEYYNEGKVTNNDHILFTDFWNPTVIQIKYMKDLLGYSWILHGLVHAGSYDPYDFLGQLIGNAPWVRHAECSFFNAFDHNYFATDFHIELFASTFLNNNFEIKERLQEDLNDLKKSNKIVRTGWPMEYMENILNPYKSLNKQDIILFPHRVSSEKQVEIFLDLKQQLPQYEFIVCQEQPLSKHEYHTLLGQSKIVFSANLQETLGISVCAEGPLVDAIPLAPNRLSYTEIFEDYTEFLYPSDWTNNFKNYLLYKHKLIEKIVYTMKNYNSLVSRVHEYNRCVYKKYFFANSLINTISKDQT